MHMEKRGRNDIKNKMQKEGISFMNKNEQKTNGKMRKMTDTQCAKYRKARENRGFGPP